MSTMLEPPRVAEGGPPPPPPDEPPGGGGGGGDGEGIRFVPIASYRHLYEAELVRGLLEEEGIPAVVDGAAALNPYPSLAWAGWNGIRVLIPEDRVDDARRVLDDPAA